MARPFPASARLLQPEQFRSVLGSRRAIRGNLFTLSFMTDNGTGHARLGLIIPKRLARNAVRRNTIKRVVRERFRLRLPQLPASDLVFRLVQRPQAQGLRGLRQEIGIEVEALLDRLVSR